MMIEDVPEPRRTRDGPEVSQRICWPFSSIVQHARHDGAAVLKRYSVLPLLASSAGNCCQGRP